MGKVNAVLPHWKGLLTAAAILVPGFVVQAVESVSANFVSTATVIQGNGGAGARVTYFALQRVNPVASAGRVTAVGATTLADGNANWAQNQFNGTNGAFYVEFDSGWKADIAGTDRATKTLTLADSPVGVVTGNAYRIRRHLTIADIFGKNNEAGLLAGPNNAQADNVLLYIPEMQQVLTFFYSNVPGFTGWYQDNYTSAADVVVNPETGLMVRTKSNRDVVLYGAGSAKEGVNLTTVYPGFNLLGTLKAKRALTLSELNIYTGNGTNGLASGANPAVADNLILVNPDSTTRSYFYSDYPGFQGWYDASYQASSNVTIAPGTAFFLQRKTPRSGFYWVVPAE